MQRDLFILPSDDTGQCRLLYYDELTTPIVNPITAGRSSRKLRKPHDRMCGKMMDVIYLRYHMNDLSEIRHEYKKQNKIRGH